MPGRGELARLAPRPLPLGAGAHASALDAVSLDVWQHCAFSSLLGHREVCALMCVSRGLAQLMANERIWRSLFLAAMNTPALSDVAHWRSAFKQRTLAGARWRMDSMVRSRVTWKWFVSRCMSSRAPERVGVHFETLRVCRHTHAACLAARALARGGVVGLGSEANVGARVPILARACTPLAGLPRDGADASSALLAADAAEAAARVFAAFDRAARPPALPGSASAAEERPPAASLVAATSALELTDAPTPPPAAGGLQAEPQPQFYDREGRRVFARIGDAIAAAAPLDRILVEPGEYYENLVVDKPLEILGSESAQPVVVRGGSCAATVWLTASCRLSRLTLTQAAATADSPVLATVLASSGLHVLLDECDVSSDAGHAIVVKGSRTRAALRHNRVHGSRGVGVLFCDDAAGSLVDCVVYANKRAGVAVLRGGAPHVLSNLIRDGEDSGVLVSEAGRGRIEANLIRANTRAGVAVLQGGAPHVLRNHILGGKDSGVLVCEGGEGVIEHNTIAANRIAGVAVCSGAAPHLLHNRVGKGGGRALCVANGCAPLVEENTFEATQTSLAVPAGLRASLPLRNRLSDAPVLPQAELDALLAASAHAGGSCSCAQPAVGARRGTDSALDDTLSPLGISRATRRTASILNAIVLKRSRLRSV